MIATLALTGGLFLASCGTGLLVIKRIKRLALACYPEVTAIVEVGEVYQTANDKSPFLGGVMYAYVVDDRRYSGWCARPTRTAQEAWRFVSDCLAKRLIARYKPENPMESLLFGMDPAARFYPIRNFERN